MAENDDTGAESAGDAAPKSRKKLIIIAAVALLVIAGGGGVFFKLKSSHHDEAKTAEAQPAKSVFMDVPEVLVNLAGSPGERIQYLKVKAVLEVKDHGQVEKIQPAMPRITDIFQTYLRELRSADLNGSAGLFRLKEELTRRVNVAAAPGQVNAVLFKEVVIQ